MTQTKTKTKLKSVSKVNVQSVPKETSSTSNLSLKNISTQSSAEMFPRATKSVIKISDTEEVYEKNLHLETKETEEEKSIIFNLDTLTKSFHKCNQSGYRSMKDFETSVTGENCIKLDLKITPEPKKTGDMNYLNINKWKNTYRSGYQHQAIDNPTGSEQLLLMGVRQPELIKPGSIFGSSNGANGKNGWERNSLYYADYLNIDGVGRRNDPFK